MERSRLALIAPPKPDRAAVWGKWTGFLGCLLSVVLMLCLLAALTIGAVRWAIR